MRLIFEPKMSRSLKFSLETPKSDRLLAGTARETIDSNGLDIKLITPALTSLKAAFDPGFHCDSSCSTAYYDDSGNLVEGNYAAYMGPRIVALGDSLCDAVDLHLHVDDVADIQYKINLVEPITNLPLVSTEWSQWGEVLAKFNENADLFFFVRDAYYDPVDSAAWFDFMDTLDLNRNFIPDAFTVMKAHDFLLACYGSLMQYGSPDIPGQMAHSTKSLITNITTRDSGVYANEPLFSLLRHEAMYRDIIDLTLDLDSAGVQLDWSPLFYQNGDSVIYEIHHSPVPYFSVSEETFLAETNQVGYFVPFLGSMPETAFYRVVARLE